MEFTWTEALFLRALVSRSELDEANALMKSETAVCIFGKYFIKYRVNLQTFLLIIYNKSREGIQQSGAILRIHDLEPFLLDIRCGRRMHLGRLWILTDMDSEG